MFRLDCMRGSWNLTMQGSCEEFRVLMEFPLCTLKLVNVRTQRTSYAPLTLCTYFFFLFQISNKPIASPPSG